MAAKRSVRADFDRRRAREGWTRLVEYSDFQQFTNFVNYTANTYHQKFGPYAMEQVKKFYPEVEKEAGPGARAKGPIAIFLDEGAGQNFVSVSKVSEDIVFIWSCRKAADDQGTPVAPLDGAGCLTKLGVLAVGPRPNLSLPFQEQEDKAFMWKAPSFHPLQVLENAYQRVVRKAGLVADSDPVQAQSETLSRYFIQDPGKPECFEHRPLDSNGGHLASVRMNHLIDSFYLFRLLVHYRVDAAAEVGEDLRAELSGDLTKLLHNGDKTKMRWLNDWLTQKMGELAVKTKELNKGGKKRAIFFLKGGRALNYFLGTPEKGENDWDTQVVIDPGLPAEEWYQCFSDLHDIMLSTLTRFKTEFSQLVQQNSRQFSEYVGAAAPQEADDEETDENEAGDVQSLNEHANCKAELIDIGIPRRDSPSALEEWTHLSAPNALLESNGVVYPNREYYVNEYLMMVRDAFMPNAEVRKAPKRIARLGLLLQNDRGREEGPPAGAKGVAALPNTAAAVSGVADKGKRELFGVIASQFVEAYNLHQDKELAAAFDRECAALVSNPPPLPPALDALLDADQKATASIVGVAHQLSTRMDEHWGSRNQFFEDRLPFFSGFVRDLARSTTAALQQNRAQFTVAGSYAARLHADHLRISVDGLEPIRRILVKLQCGQGTNHVAVMNAVRDDIRKAAEATGKLAVVDVSEGEKQSLLLFWNQKVTIGAFNYAPLVMKLRVAEQRGPQLPVLSSIDGIPVLDPRYLVADYLKKTAKIDERGARRVLAAATAAVSEMMSKFDFDSDDVG